MSEKPAVSDYLRWGLTAILVGVFIYWLTTAQGYIGKVPTKDSGTGLVTDSYAQAKELLAIVVQFLTLVLGYWFGAKGVDDAKKDATSAKQEASIANVKAEKLASVASKDDYQSLVDKYPALFGAK